MQKTQKEIELYLLKRKKFNDKLIVNSINEIINPLLVVYNSLCKIKCKALADGSVLDLIRRAYAFGLNLAKLDIRQEASRHTDIISKIYKHKFKKDYLKINEKEKISFLLNLSSQIKRFLIKE